MFQLDKNNKNTVKAATKRGFEQSEKAPLGSIAKSTSPCPSVDTVISAIRTARSKRFELLSSVRFDKELEQAEFKEWLQNRWLNVCSKSGLVDINDDDKVDAFIKHSLDVKFNCSTSDYLAKFDDKANWGVDREIAKASSKNSKKNGMHPFELAHKGYSQLFIEYTEAIKGKAQLFWSRDLKKSWYC